MKKLQYNSPVILTFFFASLAVLVLDALTGGASTMAAFCVYRSPLSPLFFLRLFGHVLGHSGVQHFLGNMTLLLVAALYLGEQVYDIVFVRDNVANFMHIVGGACGTGFGFAAARPRRRHGGL